MKLVQDIINNFIFKEKNLSRDFLATMIYSQFNLS